MIPRNVCVCVCVCVEREREREVKDSVLFFIHGPTTQQDVRSFMYVSCMYVYIYTYTCIFQLVFLILKTIDSLIKTSYAILCFYVTIPFMLWPEIALYSYFQNEHAKMHHSVFKGPLCWPSQNDLLEMRISPLI